MTKLQKGLILLVTLAVTLAISTLGAYATWTHH